MTGADTLQGAYYAMLCSRFVDDRCKELAAQGIPVPNFHSGTGQEATGVGVALGLTNQDYYLYTHRDYAGLIARGIPVAQLAGDLLLRSSGTTRGFGGIMHVVDPHRGIVGRNGVFGSRFGIALGLSLRFKRRQEPGVVMVAFGEAEGSRGPLYEALNLACLWQSPIVFVAENNGFSISARTEDLYAGGDMSTVWKGMPLPVISVDGNDFEQVYTTAGALYDRARCGGGPSFLECRTYRVDPHHGHDAEGYRTSAEVEAWRARDPLAGMERLLVTRRRLDRDGIAEMRAKARKVVDDAFAEALAAPPPAESDAREYVYATGGRRLA